ncbi:S-layer homology domain-containing protein [Paenibacillus wynnii]|uniref:S-layer homology domain-containing protein n=1 Tax=Paenibacillus wynnii TaxID=268407 RepID=UPI00279012A3|nr:S-layer homology domain-containing protein [Paenibacillus wynnii]MDQ0194141.1 hypothetical protein [Paenibacillus wynnii]
MTFMIRDNARKYPKLHKLVAFTAGLLLSSNILLIHPVSTSAAGRNEPSGWATEEVTKAYAQNLVPYGLMSNFQNAITRAELSQIAVRLYENMTGLKAVMPASNPFKDTKDDNVLKAYALNIVGGMGNNSFAPNEPVTREQIAVMLYNTLQKAGIADRLKSSSPPAFTDASAVASWAGSAVNKLSSSGILQGTESKGGIAFQPKAKASREQIFVLAFRIYDLYGPVFVRNEHELLEAVEQSVKPLLFQDDRTKKIYEESARVAADIIKPGMSDMEKEIAIHDYIILHTAYDYDNYLKDTLPDDVFSAYGVLFNGSAVCQGYAYTAHLLLELAGIDSEIVIGTADGISHAWNKVKIDNEYYNLDVTWDDPVPDEKGRLIYSYFNVTDKELMKDHIWETAKWPEATAISKNYYEYKGLAVHSAGELKDRIAKTIAAHETELDIKPAYEGDALADLTAAMATSQVLSGYSYSYNGMSLSLKLEYR